jgi:hypothetical protein
VPQFGAAADDKCVSVLSSNCHFRVMRVSVFTRQTAAIPTTKGRIMKALTRTLFLPLLAAAGIAAGTAHAMPKPFSPLDAGMLVANTDGNRNIEIGTGTRYVNVTNGETVTFTVDGQRFAYAFNAWNSIGVINLSAIAPKDLKVPEVRVYIAPNPIGQG